MVDVVVSGFGAYPPYPPAFPYAGTPACAEAAKRAASVKDAWKNILVYISFLISFCNMFGT